MCFSSTASFAASGVIATIGGATLTQVKKKHEWLFASTPLLFALQQCAEGFVWLTLADGGAQWAVYLFLTFAYVVWPSFVPIAVYLIEKDPVRKNLMKYLAGIGTGVSLYLLYVIVKDVPVVSALNHHLVYNTHVRYGTVVALLYFLVTCLSPLLSSSFRIRVFGGTIFAALLVSLGFFYFTYISVWCFFSALLSMLVFWHFKRTES